MPTELHLCASLSRTSLRRPSIFVVSIDITNKITEYNSNINDELSRVQTKVSLSSTPTNTHAKFLLLFVR